MKIAIKRVIAVVVGLLLQIALDLLISLFFIEHVAIIHLFYSLLGFLLVLGLIRNSKSYSYSLPWIIILVLFPLIGTLMYITLGKNKMKSKVLNSIVKNEKESKNYLVQDDKIREEIKNNGKIRYLCDYSKYPATKNNDVVYYPIGEDAFLSMIEELEKAEKFIFFEYFIVNHGKMWDTILDILEKKVKQGVDVRVVIPGIPDKKIVYTLSESYVEPLVNGGLKYINIHQDFFIQKYLYLMII